MRENIVNGKPRIDGRDTRTVRPLKIEVGVLDKTHGSALFTRGETQALVVATLGTARDAQILDTLEGEKKDPFLLHYNFPPYSVGECGRMGATGRREIGHGRLARRGVQAMLPSADEFPYTIRVVSEITESNGSSSMASVCGASLALMDAGVPMKAPVAGIAMGLVKEGDKFAVLTDILGDEDHLGDMDFKVAGTAKGVTALQMDIKIQGITEEIMEIALNQALEARLNILGQMNQVISQSRSELSANAPTMIAMKIDPDKIRDVIGKGGAVIRGICEETKAPSTSRTTAPSRSSARPRKPPRPPSSACWRSPPSRDRQDLHRPRRAHRRLRRLRQHPARQGRPGAHLHAERSARGEGHRHTQGRSGSGSAGAGRGQPRPHQAVHQGRRRRQGLPGLSETGTKRPRKGPFSFPDRESERGQSAGCSELREGLPGLPLHCGRRVPWSPLKTQE